MRKLFSLLIFSLSLLLLAAAPSWGAQLTRAQFFQKLAGVALSHIGIANVCSSHSGQATCMAQELVNSSTGVPLTPQNLQTLTQNNNVTGAVPLTPQQLQTAYGETPFSSAATPTVAILSVGNDSTISSDLNFFRSHNGLNPLSNCTAQQNSNCFELLNQTGGATVTAPRDSEVVNSNGNQIEETLDVEAVSSICPHCRIIDVEANGADYSNFSAAYATAVAQNPTVISNSWGYFASSSNGEGEWNVFSSAVPTFSASGDYEFENDSYMAANTGMTYPNTMVYPAATIDNVAVGGTTLYASSTARGYSETVWDNPRSRGAGSGCDTSESIPSYQQGLDTGCSGRAYSDISADADPYSGIDIILTQEDTVGSVPYLATGSVGGTSLATPLTAAWAAMSGNATTTDSTGDSTPAWIYNDSSELNPVLSGTNGEGAYGTCSSSPLCVAGLSAWSGPAGMGSINFNAPSTPSPPITNPGSSISVPVLPSTWTTVATSTGVTLSGTVLPGGNALLTLAIGAQTQTLSVLGYAEQQQSISLLTLTPETSYNYTLTAANAKGSVLQTGTFTTPATLVSGGDTGVIQPNAPGLIGGAGISPLSEGNIIPPVGGIKTVTVANPHINVLVKALTHNSIRVFVVSKNLTGSYTLTLAWGPRKNIDVKVGRSYSHRFSKHGRYTLKLTLKTGGKTYVVNRSVLA